MAGKILVDEKPATKAGTSIPKAPVRLKPAGHLYVSRGG